MFGIVRPEDLDVSRGARNFRGLLQSAQSSEREAFARKQAKEAAAFEAKQVAEMEQFKQTLERLAHSMKPAGKLERPKGLASMFT